MDATKNKNATENLESEEESLEEENLTWGQKKQRSQLPNHGSNDVDGTTDNGNDRMDEVKEPSFGN